ncbi:ArnT family glycosyltransferase [Arthrobacter sp. HS15c]|uniref:ArnT family glycosyltransferase n=1 Tax=Arthrobacter sp. HS15c TaxID=3230279 RepID=UPI003467B523
MLYIGNIGINGWANSFYSAAVQAGTMDWKAFFFGSSDWGNSITVDKPPLSLWIMGISARLFGLSPESVLIPQAVIGVMTTLLVYLVIRRSFSPVAALASALVFFTTPIITLLSRYNNPDPLMLLLMVAGAYLVIRTVESGKANYFAWAGIFLGLGFMTKQLQAMISLPALAVAFVVCSPTAWWHKIRTCCVGLATLTVTAGFWMTAVELIAPTDRPYIGGSTNNSAVQLTLAYNGLNRIIPMAKDPTVGLIPSQFKSSDSDAGLFRLLNTNFFQEAGWLLAAGLLSCLWIVVAWRNLSDSPTRRATLIISVTWFLTTYFMLSFMGDGIHTYYTATLAPPLALIIGLGIESLLSLKSKLWARLMASFTVLSGSLIAWALMNAAEGWHLGLTTTILTAGLAGAVLLAVKPPANWINVLACALSAVGLIAAPLATALYTTTVAHSGSNPLSGPATKSASSISRFLESVSQHEPAWAYDMGFGFDPGPHLTALARDTDSCTWGAATYPSQSAAKLQLATSRAVLPLGGFAGTDPAPTLAEFQQIVERGDICFLIWHEDHLNLPGRSITLIEISDWVKSRFVYTVIDGTTVYDLRLLKSQ